MAEHLGFRSQKAKCNQVQLRGCIINLTHDSKRRLSRTNKVRAT